ncbi:Phosphorelay protein LuxU [Vibrio chagasii]|uniref:Hpt domain-containing protein n=1 Tax=Vibrio TaxID=662 RepID=UPI00076AB567|nr:MULTISPECIES: Hpt domain-containing protein [Vibrio]MCG9675542.1 Hpt domain-containing protein [Vibrio chagasii]NOI40429.1 Hpt domain-containing protein [Vibrio sp. 070316B]CAH6803997.1 Phosphorelay protein LuxU [Vibrio chagasii]CAH6806751.1 Phosphorelay protein LuxU [Vibrio chagasii]CAH6811641.1 Phosphorelay protein LuxU [Vibrio chagasii]
MEQSVAKPTRFNKPATFLVVILVLWLLPSLALLNLSRSYTNSLAQIEELGIRVNELRQSLYFSEPLRVSRINELALDAQLVYSIRLQIESDFQNAFFRPDVNQLLYVADQFLDKFDEFIPIESQVQEIVDNIKLLRADKQLSPKLKPLLNEFGVVVFEAMYSDSQSSSATYRAFDSILERSYKLKTEEQDAIQQLLADASALLVDYAQLNFLVDKIKQNSVNKQIIKLEAEYHERQFNLLLVMLGLSLVAMGALVVWSINVRKSAQQPKAELSADPEPSMEKVVQFSDKEELFPETSVEPPPSVTEKLESDSDAASNQQTQPLQTMDTASQPDLQEAALTERHAASVTDSKPAIDIEDMLETLDGDAESVELLLGVFVQDHANDFEKFKALLTKDETSAARIVHSLKGVAGSIKASRLAIIAASIEMTMKQSRAISEHDLTELEQAIRASVDSAVEYLDNQR